MIVYDIEYRPDDEQVWHNCLIGVRNRSEGERYHAGVNRGEDDNEFYDSGVSIEQQIRRGGDYAVGLGWQNNSW